MPNPALLLVLIPLLTPVPGAAAPALPQSAQAELLSDPPEGWAFERLDLPLSFAPDLEHEGFEELYFAPGMFTEGAPDFFTYVLALKLTDVDAVDEALLRHFLQEYYDGLAQAVGRSRRLDTAEWSTVTVVTPVLGGYRATIDMVEPFVTGKPLRLHLDLRVHEGPRDVQVYASVSPRPREHEVWKDLRGFEERWLEARPAAVYLNHLFFVVDDATYAAVRDSEFLRGAFAVSEERETVRSDTSYEGVYFYGRRTYFELLPAGAAGLDAGATGVAMGVERPDAHAGLAARLAEHDLQAFRSTVTRRHDGDDVPWFDILGVGALHADSTLSLFSMEYAPAFLERFHAASDGNAGIRRAAVMARYARALSGEDATAPLFEDVSEITLQVGADERRRLERLGRACGYVREESGTTVLLQGPQFRLRLEPGEGSGGVTGFRATLRRDVQREPLQLGRLRVVFDGAEAIFTLSDA